MGDSSVGRAEIRRWCHLRWPDNHSRRRLYHIKIYKEKTGLTIKINETEEELFKKCTTIQIGNGNKIRFWKDNWLDGKAPKDTAPECFKLAWRKNQLLSTALQRGRWMRGLRRISTEEQLRQFVDLWNQIQMMHLQEHEDTISWRLKPSGQYSARSAYNAQVIGAFQTRTGARSGR